MAELYCDFIFLGCGAVVALLRLRWYWCATIIRLLSTHLRSIRQFLWPDAKHRSCLSHSLCHSLISSARKFQSRKLSTSLSPPIWLPSLRWLAGSCLHFLVAWDWDRYLSTWSSTTSIDHGPFVSKSMYFARTLDRIFHVQIYWEKKDGGGAGGVVVASQYRSHRRDEEKRTKQKFRWPVWSQTQASRKWIQAGLCFTPLPFNDGYFNRPSVPTAHLLSCHCSGLLSARSKCQIFIISNDAGCVVSGKSISQVGGCV